MEAPPGLDERAAKLPTSRARTRRARCRDVWENGAMPLLPVRWMYGRLGRAYPTAFFALQLSIGTAVTAGTLFLVTLFYEGARREFVTLLVITEALTIAGLTYGFAKALPRLRPLREWIAGRRDERSTLAAWDAAVN